jgi:hypothetical protein
MLIYFMTIWNILLPFGICNAWPFGIVCGHLVYFSRFGTFRPRKIWQPCRQPQNNEKTLIAGHGELDVELGAGLPEEVAVDAI